MKIQTKNILKIADMKSSLFDENFIKFIQTETESTYKDRVLNEHIYNVDTITDDMQERWIFKHLGIFARIKNHCDANDCSYFRIVF